jgi:hypothetical protein
MIAIAYVPFLKRAFGMFSFQRTTAADTRHWRSDRAGAGAVKWMRRRGWFGDSRERTATAPTKVLDPLLSRPNATSLYQRRRVGILAQDDASGADHKGRATANCRAA